MISQIRRKNEKLYLKDSFDALAQLKARLLLRSYNNMMPYNIIKITTLLPKILKKTGRGLIYCEPPFYCEYGTNIEVGDNFYANKNFMVLDDASVKIGNNVFIGPNVSIFTSGHPIHPEMRNSRYEYAIPVSIGDNVWIGGGTTIVPGVNIASNTVIGAGSVVTKNIPDYVIAAGNPCKVIRKITDEDKNFYFKNREIDKITKMKIKLRTIISNKLLELIPNGYFKNSGKN